MEKRNSCPKWRQITGTNSDVQTIQPYIVNRQRLKHTLASPSTLHINLFLLIYVHLLHAAHCNVREDYKIGLHLHVMNLLGGSEVAV